MGYRVEYQQVKKARRGEKRTSRLAALTVLCLFLFLLLVNGFWPRGAEALRDLLLPGDAAVTVAALEDLALELRTGEELSSALENFCRKVVSEAELGSD